MTPDANLLEDATSAYLRTARDQPVHWRPWGREALEEARETGKPILLDVGAVWCHWCHVMDHESYEDASTAKLINDLFVPVKVDRDERPDVDTRYQKAVQALTGQGGWPLTAFLTPEGEAFYGGTYFPPEPTHGRPAFREVLEAVARFYEEEPESVRDRAERIRSVVETSGAGDPGEVSLEHVEEATAAVREAADPVHGGFGGAPKFPQPGAVDLLLLDVVRGDGDASWHVAEATLEGMARGGIRDHVGGGFHRYSVDAEWHVPHFEKMAYDNAELLRNYVHAAQVRSEPSFREVARETAWWCRTVLGDPDEGGFFGSVDADVGPHDDGDHWTWTREEVRDVLPREMARVVELRFGVEERGDMRHDRARNVLRIEHDLDAIAESLDRTEGEVRELLDEALDRLLEARNQRPRPHVDTTLYTDWNGMLVTAFLEAAPVVDEPWVREHALRSLERVHEAAWTRDQGYAHAVGPEGASVHGLLGDHVHVARARLAAYEVTLDPEHLDAARRLADLLLEHWWDADEGGFVDHAPALREGPGEGALLEVPEKPLMDSPTPGLNPLAAVLLARLHHATGAERYGEAARGTLEALAGRARDAGVHGATFHLATWAVHGTPPTIVLVGDRNAEGFEALHRAALGPYAPGRSVVHHEPGAGGHVPPAAEDALEELSKEGAAALVCAGNRCYPPAREPDEVSQRVRDALADR